MKQSSFVTVFSLLLLSLCSVPFVSCPKSLVLRSELHTDCMTSWSHSYSPLFTHICYGTLNQQFLYNDTEKRIRNTRYPRCLRSVTDQKAVSRRTPVLDNCNSNNDQKWSWRSDKTIRPESDDTLCLTAQPKEPKDVTGAKLLISECKNLNSQFWYRQQCGSGTQLHSNGHSCTNCAENSFKNGTRDEDQCNPCNRTQISAARSFECKECSGNLCPYLELTPHHLNYDDKSFLFNNTRDVEVKIASDAVLPVYVSITYLRHLYIVKPCFLTFYDRNPQTIKVTAKPWRTGASIDNYQSHITFTSSAVNASVGGTPSRTTGCSSRTQKMVVARDFQEQRFCWAAGHGSYFTFDAETFNIPKEQTAKRFHYILNSHETTVIGMTSPCLFRNNEIKVDRIQHHCYHKIAIRNYNSYFTVKLRNLKDEFPSSPDADYVRAINDLRDRNKRPFESFILNNTDSHITQVHDNFVNETLNDGSLFTRHTVGVSLGENSYVSIVAHYIGKDQGWLTWIGVHLPGHYYGRTSGLCKNTSLLEPLEPATFIRDTRNLVNFVAPEDNYFECLQPNEPSIPGKVRCRNTTIVDWVDCPTPNPSVPINFCRPVTTSASSFSTRLAASSAGVSSQSDGIHHSSTNSAGSSSSIHHEHNPEKTSSTHASSSIHYEKDPEKTSSTHESHFSSDDSVEKDFSTSISESDGYLTTTISTTTADSKPPIKIIEIDNSDKPNPEKCIANSCYDVTAYFPIPRPPRSSETEEKYCQEIFNIARCFPGHFEKSVDHCKQNFQNIRSVSLAAAKDCAEYFYELFMNSETCPDAMAKAALYPIGVTRYECGSRSGNGTKGEASTVVKGFLTSTEEDPLFGDPQELVSITYGSAVAMVVIGAAVGGIAVLLKRKRKLAETKSDKLALFNNPLFDKTDEFKESQIYTNAQDSDAVDIKGSNTRLSRRFSNS